MNRYAYDEFGETLAKDEPIAQPFGYVGQFGVIQEPNGLLFMRARYYSPPIGRFVSIDPAPRSETPSDLNLFAYVSNSPIGSIDPNGLKGFAIFGNSKELRERNQAATDAIIDDPSDENARALQQVQIEAINEVKDAAEASTAIVYSSHFVGAPTGGLGLTKAVFKAFSLKGGWAIGLLSDALTLVDAFTHTSKNRVSMPVASDAPEDSGQVVTTEQLEVHAPSTRGNQKHKRDQGR